MTTTLSRRVVRQTSYRDYVSGAPVIIELCAGGKLVRLHAKGRRTTYTLPVSRLWLLGGELAAAEIRAQKQRDRAARVQQRVWERHRSKPHLVT